MCASAVSDIASDEEVIFFNTAAHLDAPAGQWVIPVHGWIFEPEADSIRRNLALAALQETLGIDDDDEEEARIFTARGARFLVDNERGKTLELFYGGRKLAVGPSERNGHFTGTVRLSVAEVEQFARQDVFGRRWLDFTAVTPLLDSRRFTGRAALVEPAGVSVISDIDDTIKITQITDREKMLRNTFLRPYRPVPDMAELYRRWARHGAVFHFVSASPWQLYEPLTDFMSEQNFPAGTFHLKTFYWKDSRFLSLFDDPTEYKPKVIEPIMKLFPQRRFVFVGDSGEKDPEVYGALARKYSEQVLHIFIRAVEKEPPDARRFREAFEGLPRERWRVFTNPEELKGVVLPRIASTRPVSSTQATPADGGSPEK